MIYLCMITVNNIHDLLHESSSTITNQYHKLKDNQDVNYKTVSFTTTDSSPSLPQCKGLPAVETTEVKVAFEVKLVVLRAETLTSMKTRMNIVAST
jgi:hypothetical protein